MRLKEIGGILMILGTSIGAGMIALPVASSQEGFITSTVLLLAVWAIMTIGAFCILEVVLCLPKNTNMISMAKATLGKPGEIVAWVSYLLLLYALLCAYISSNSDVLQWLLALINIHIARFVATILVVVLFGIIIYKGIRSIDLVNRLLMFIKITAFLLLVFFITPHINTSLLAAGQARIAMSTIMVMITSFGFAIIVPSLRNYFHDDIPALKRVIFIGSLIPLVSYIAWIAMVQGVLSLSKLQQLEHALNTTTGLSLALSSVIRSDYIASVIHAFTSICTFTSFLGVSLCLFDFLADGCGLNKKGKHGAIVFTITFLPPLSIVLLAPGIFIRALSYAGIFCIIVLMLLPAMMAYSRRYIKKMPAPYQLLGGKALLLVELAACCGLIAFNIVDAYALF